MERAKRHGLSRKGEDEIDNMNNDRRIEDSGSLARDDTCSLDADNMDGLGVDGESGYWRRLLVEGVVVVPASAERAFCVVLTCRRMVVDRPCLEREDNEALGASGFMI